MGHDDLLREAADTLWPDRHTERGATGVTGSLFVLASAVEESEQSWLFPQLAPLGTLALLAGDGGTGKSTLLRELAARASRGQALFAGQQPPERPAAVVYLASEDSPTATLVPGLREAGADLERVSLIAPDADDAPTFPSGIDALRSRVEATGARLVIVDCATDFMDAGLNPDKEVDIRWFLRPLRALAGAFDFAVIVAVHINKGRGVSARDRILGGVAWRNTARHVVMMASPPDSADDAPDRLVVTVKSNIALRGVGYALRISTEGCRVPSVG